MNQAIFGHELILDLHGCNQNTITCENSIKDFAQQLCEVIDMIPHGEPQTPYFGENLSHTKGYSLLQFIETSSITGHFSESTGSAYINIFSCNPFDEKKATEFTNQYFEANEIQSHFIERR